MNLLKSFGINSIDKEKMITVNARVIEPPGLAYAGYKKPMIQNGKWRMANNMCLFQTPILENWLIITTVGNKPPSKDDEYLKLRFMNEIMNTFQNGGIRCSKPMYQCLPTNTIPEIFEMVKKNCAKKPQLVMFIIKTGEQYEQIKKIAEKDLGLMTQCINFDKLCQQIDDSIDDPTIVGKDRNLSNYLSNVLLKVNAKLGGINNIVDFSKLQK